MIHTYVIVVPFLCLEYAGRHGGARAGSRGRKGDQPARADLAAAAPPPFLDPGKVYVQCAYHVTTRCACAEAVASRPLIADVSNVDFSALFTPPPKARGRTSGIPC